MYQRPAIEDQRSVEGKLWSPGAPGGRHKRHGRKRRGRGRHS